ncbi:MAG TPA: SRPBCC domain-containing protein [Thermoplasmata archaeon]|nr:SRPBCC domain-containing protein [Thermoplasmata archaeon]
MPPEEPLDPILIQVTSPLPTGLILSAFTDSAHVAGWLAKAAVVEPRVGGRYDLTFEGEVPFVSHGTVRTLTPELDVGFDWEGPPAFAALMNGPPPLTHVYVRLQESPEGIDITLEHSGWGTGPAWEEARSWHFHFWDERLHLLKDYLMKVAYG